MAPLSLFLRHSLVIDDDLEITEDRCATHREDRMNVTTAVKRQTSSSFTTSCRWNDAASSQMPPRLPSRRSFEDKEFEEPMADLTEISSDDDESTTIEVEEEDDVCWAVRESATFTPPTPSMAQAASPVTLPSSILKSLLFQQSSLYYLLSLGGFCKGSASREEQRQRRRTEHESLKQIRI